MLRLRRVEKMRGLCNIFVIASIICCFFFGPESVLAREGFQEGQSHSFVADVASKVSPSVVRIDIEREIETDEFEEWFLKQGSVAPMKLHIPC